MNDLQNTRLHIDLFDPQSTQVRIEWLVQLTQDFFGFEDPENPRRQKSIP
jgi:hypothetical protein